MANESAASEPAPAGHDLAATIQRPEVRAAEIAAALKLDAPEKSRRIESLIANYYHQLQGIYSVRDARIAEAAGRPGDAAVAEAWRGVARNNASLKLFPLHRRFAARLEAELTPEQLNQVKNEMTDNLLPTTLEACRAALPNLTSTQQTEMLASLLEAREYAMDAATAAEIDDWFARCRARINQQLSAAGHDTADIEAKLANPSSSAKPSR